MDVAIIFATGFGILWLVAMLWAWLTERKRAREAEAETLSWIEAARELREAWDGTLADLAICQASNRKLGSAVAKAAKKAKQDPAKAAKPRAAKKG